MGKPAYQERPPESIRQAIWSQGHISPWQLFRIVSWKSAKGVAALCLNDEAQVVTITGAAVHAIGQWRDRDVTAPGVDWEQWEHDARTAIGSKRHGTGLLALAGVGYPVATAVLAFVAPAVFPVMDKWAVQAVFGPSIARGTSWHRGAAYRAYAEALATSPALARRGNVHERDQFVMQSMMDHKPINGLRPVLLPDR